MRERPIRTGEAVAGTAGRSADRWLDLPKGAGVLEPAGTPLAAVESMRTERIHRAVFGHAKIVHVLEGRARIETATGTHECSAGTAMALGAGRWCTVQPEPAVRMWTIFLDETFLRSHMRWVLWDVRRALPGMHPDSWDGSALILRPGVELLRRAEPFWRQISVVGDTVPPEVATSRRIGLFAGSVEALVPALVDPDAPLAARAPFPVTGRLSSPMLNRSVQQAAAMLRARMDELWTATRLAQEVNLSRAHLTRAFTQQVGLAPMRFLIEVRLTEFTRLMEETDLPIGVAARQVGWVDARVASSWFQRRFGLTPTEYRRHPHPSCTGQAPCEACRGTCVLPTRQNATRQMMRNSRRDAHDHPVR